MTDRSPAPINPGDEVASLAAELSRAYKEDVAFYRRHLHLDAEEADQRARGLDVTPDEVADELARIRSSPPEHLRWTDVQRLADHDPEAALALWEAVKREARDELATGHRTAKSLEWEGQPWSRARFLAIRESLRADSLPKSGIEVALIDMAAEAYSSWLELTEQATMLASTQANIERNDLQGSSRWTPPHEVAAGLVEQVTRRAEQAHQRFLRSAKMLTDVRRLAPTVYVAQAGQINVGQQQVNLAEHPPATHAAAQDLSKLSDDGDNEPRGRDGRPQQQGGG